MGAACLYLGDSLFPTLLDAYTWIVPLPERMYQEFKVQDAIQKRIKPSQMHLQTQVLTNHCPLLSLIANDKISK